MPPISLVVLAGAGFFFTLAAYYPGQLTYDSIWQFREANSGVYTDHHPPLMAWVWSIVNRLIPGPAGMLLLQLSLIWSALLLLADGAARRGIRHAWIVIAIGFLPPIIGIEGVIWKDIQMTAALLFATALVYRASAGRNRIGVVVAALSLLPFLYATAVRANAPAATAPMLMYWACCASGRRSLRSAVIVGTGALALLLGAQWAFEKVVLNTYHVYLYQYLEAFDIVAIGCAGGKVTLPPQIMRDPRSSRPVCDAFDPYKVDFLYTGAGAPLVDSIDPRVMQALGHEWRRAIVAYPALYFAHRLRVFGGLLGFGTNDGELSRPVWLPGSIPNAWGFSFEPDALTRIIGAGAIIASAIGLYNGMPWLVIAGVVLGVALHPRGKHIDPLVIALAASTLTYTLPYFFVTVAPDFRYLHWSIAAAALAATLAVLRAISDRRP